MEVGNEARLFSGVPSDTTRGYRHKVKHMKFHLSTRKYSFLLWRWSNTGIVFPEKLWSVHPWRYSKPTVNGLGKPVSACPASTVGLDKMFSRDW